MSVGYGCGRGRVCSRRLRLWSVGVREVWGVSVYMCVGLGVAMDPGMCFSVVWGVNVSDLGVVKAGVWECVCVYMCLCVYMCTCVWLCVCVCM